MKAADFDYELPESFIAQTPAEPRDAAKLLRLERATGVLSHHVFRDIVNMIMPGDVLVLNNSRVFPARLRARKAETGGAVELLMLRQAGTRRWRALVSGRNVRAGMTLEIQGASARCTVVEELDKSQRTLEFDQPVLGMLESFGEVPLPPYIRAYQGEDERYQTVYSAVAGSAAAPTAGLHFTLALLLQLQAKGVELAYCTLHIGLDTFQPVTAERADDHRIHSEFARIDVENAAIINEAKSAGGRIIAVGTTSARTLETAAINSADGEPGPYVQAYEGDTDLFIKPGYRWRAVDAIITNFHLPRSTLVMMISAFAGRETLLNAYEVAKSRDYRFYSFGDAMFIG